MRWIRAAGTRGGLIATFLACTPADPEAEPPRPSWADTVLWAPGHTGEGFRDSSRAINGARGGGLRQGSTDVFSLGWEPDLDDVLVLSWADRVLIDGPGADLVVFENPFDVTADYRFMDPVVVEVSPDGERFIAFPHAYLADDPTTYDGHPALWEGFAGITPVRLHEEDHPVDPFGPEAGGDAFDLADLPEEDPLTAEILEHGVLAVRLRAASQHIDPRTGGAFPMDQASDGPDIDAVYARWFEE